MRKIIERAREPSTWAGVSALLALFMPPEAAEGLGQLLGGAAALAAVFMAERK